jgi:hypothetical protein
MWFSAKIRNSLYICIVSSLVGAITNAFKPSPRFILASRGAANAIDFPEPVSARMIADYLLAINGIACICTGVGLR